MTAPDTSSPKTTTATPSAPTSGLQALLGTPPPTPWWKRPSLWASIILIALAVWGYQYWQQRQEANAAPRFVTEELRKGDITLSVAANGTLQPTRSVSIGSELSGTVRRVLVDVNDQVKKGQLLVELDPSKLSAQVLRSRASLASAYARLAQTGATVKEASANLARLEEVARLSGGKVPSEAELDTGRATLARAQADEASARASVEDAKAALSTDETNLGKASIRSPIDGIVLSRTVEPGNAVAASLQAVTLFTVAEDLKQLELQVNVDEADVGAVQIGQKASFTVSAYPSRKYPAKITRVAYGSTKSDNVVTYITWMEVDNQDLSLRPGMTAAATITATERTGVLVVPNTSLRFMPRLASNAQDKPASGGGLVSKLMPRPPRGAGQGGGRKAGEEGSSHGKMRQIWILNNGTPQAMPVRAGISDGRLTEISGEGLTLGMAVITDQRSAKAAP